MWLPRDERQVLVKYYNYLQNTQEYKRFESLSKKVHIATRNLINRNLLHEIKEHSEEHTQFLAAFIAENAIDLNKLLPSEDNDIDCNDITLRLTLEGYDLASKYNKWFTRTGLWFAEYKNHWIIFILGYLGGITSTLIVEWLKEKI